MALRSINVTGRARRTAMIVGRKAPAKYLAWLILGKTRVVLSSGLPSLFLGLPNLAVGVGVSVMVTKVGFPEMVVAMAVVMAGGGTVMRVMVMVVPPIVVT